MAFGYLNCFNTECASEQSTEIYAALSLDHSSEYDTVKTTILNAYELVPEAYQ